MSIFISYSCGIALSTVETTSLRPLGEADPKVFEIYGPSVVILKHPHKYKSLDGRKYTFLILSSRLFDINDLVTLSEILSIRFNPSLLASLVLSVARPSSLMLPRNNHRYSREFSKVLTLAAET